MKPKTPRKRASSALESQFLIAWRAISGPAPNCEYQFHPSRKWRFDFAWPDAMVAVEIEGGVFEGRAFGRHTKAQGFIDDATKYNNAAALGWRVFRLTGEMIDMENLRMILEAM